MSSTPLLVLSTAGLEAASVATPTGPFIEINKFAVGSAYGYEVTADQKTLNGNLLYEGGLSGYASVGDGVIAITCKIPPDAGPFDFGEVALYLNDGTLFAKAAFDSLQTKYSSLGTNLAMTYTFVCMLKLEQSTATFKITTETDSSNTLLQLSSWSEVVPAGLAADPNIQMMLVKELDSFGQATMLLQSSDTKWVPASTYYRAGSFEVANAAATWVEVAAADWPYLTGVALSGIELSSLLVETDDGFFRSVASVQHVGNPVTAVRFLLNPDPLLNIPVIGSEVIIHSNILRVGNTGTTSSSGSGTTIPEDGQPLAISISGNAATADLALEANHAKSADLATSASSCPSAFPKTGGEIEGHKIGLLGGSIWNNGNTMYVASNLSMNDDMTAWLAKAGGKASLYMADGATGSHRWFSINTSMAQGASAVPTQTGILDGAGNLTATANVAAYSDARLKEDLERITTALDKVDQLAGYTYHRKDLATPDRAAGLLAQDVGKVLPEAVLNIEGTLALAHGGLIALLVEAVKELRAEINVIKTKL